MSDIIHLVTLPLRLLVMLAGAILHLGFAFLIPILFVYGDEWAFAPTGFYPTPIVYLVVAILAVFWGVVAFWRWLKLTRVKWHRLFK